MPWSVEIFGVNSCFHHSRVHLLDSIDDFKVWRNHVFFEERRVIIDELFWDLDCSHSESAIAKR